MRFIQTFFFVLGFAAFLVALFFAGTGTGDTLWRIGIAALLLDVVCILLWPAPAPRTEATGS